MIPPNRANASREYRAELRWLIREQQRIAARIAELKDILVNVYGEAA
jgi:hypothetical protein